MYAQNYIRQGCTLLVIVLLLCNFQTSLHAQLGMNPTDTIYGLTPTGQITAINVNTVGNVTIGSPAASAMNANGMGWRSANQRFYFFNQTGGGVTEFVSFDPITGAKTTLANPSSPIIPTNQKIRSGTVTPDGAGYYTIFPGATTAMGYASTNPAFYYYNMVANTWTLVSQNFRNSTNTVTVANIATLNSGDMAFDASGNLYIIVSSSANYALYRINTPIPTAAGSTIRVDTVLSQRATPGGVSFTGIAFNSLGMLYMSTGSGVGANNNKLYKMTSPSAPLTYMGTFPDGYGDDLTSTVYPNAVLPSVWVDFSASLNDQHVTLKWKVNEFDLFRYAVEYSNDGRRWQEIAIVHGAHAGGDAQRNYRYDDNRIGVKTGFYRIVQLSASGARNISAIRSISGSGKSKIAVWPNPVVDELTINYQDMSLPYTVKLYDKLGRIVYSSTLEGSMSTIHVGFLKKGFYILKLVSREQSLFTSSFIKN